MDGGDGGIYLVSAAFVNSCNDFDFAHSRWTCINCYREVNEAITSFIFKSLFLEIIDVFFG